ncbi:MAG: hypothetical protein PVG85_03550 [Deltaproteobacteria bacterium]|jgi:hypothetical protein
MRKEKKMILFDAKRLLGFFYAFLVVLLIVDFFVHKHADFPWEDAPGFFAAYGFGSCVLLIFIAKACRIFIKRDEDYYD